MSHTRRLICVLVALAGAAVVLPSAASAQATRTWVSGVGDDVNPCSRTAPCKTFAGAISKTAAKGEISVLDPGGYGAVTITKAITIRAVGLEGGALAGGNAFTINAGPTDRVLLDGLSIFGVSPPQTGVKFLAGKSLGVINSTIENFSAAGSAGIRNQSTTPNSRLLIRNVDVFNNQGAEAISVAPGATGSQTTLVDSTVHDNGYGVIVGGSNPAIVNVVNSTIADNANFGLAALGSFGLIRARNSFITGNGSGLGASGGGQIVSYGGNVVAGNGADGAFTSTVAPTRR